MKLRNKNCQRTKEKSINILSNVLCTIKNLLPIKNILKKLPSSGINNYIKILGKTVFQKNRNEEARQNGIR